MSDLVLGVDGGGTKTLALVATTGGELRGVGKAGGSNYQSAGESGAKAALTEAIDRALAEARASRAELRACGLGLAGYDGPLEQAIVARLVAEVLPPVPRFLENDSLLVLRAGTPEGVGVGLVAGTGQNCIGRDRAGRRLQIGGLGALSGDVAGASQLCTMALSTAWQSFDGRLPRSALSHALPAALGVGSMLEVSALAPSGEPDPAMIRAVVPAFFAMVRAGDAVAEAALGAVVVALAAAAEAALRGLGLGGDDAAVVLGGRTLQHPDYQPLPQRLAAALQARGVSVRALEVAPVVGGVLWAFDQLGTPDRARDQRLLAAAQGAGYRQDSLLRIVGV